VERCAVGPLLGGVLADAYGFRVPFIATSTLLALSGILIWRGIHEEFMPASANKGETGRFVAGWRRILSESGMGMTYTIRFLAGVGQTMIQPIAPLFIQSLLASGAGVATMTGLVAGLSAAASIASGIYLGRMSDRIGPRPVLGASLLAAAVFYFPQMAVTVVWQLLVLQVLTGAAIGGVTPTLSALLARYGRAGEEGAIYGLDNSISSAARVAAPMAGAAIAIGFNMRSTFAVIGFIFLLSTVLASTRLAATGRLPDADSVVSGI
jgi:DHA1 family multidrug resistance protein-like MFS transporter